MNNQLVLLQMYISRYIYQNELTRYGPNIIGKIYGNFILYHQQLHLKHFLLYFYINAYCQLQDSMQCLLRRSLLKRSQQLWSSSCVIVDEQLLRHIDIIFNSLKYNINCLFCCDLQYWLSKHKYCPLHPLSINISLAKKLLHYLLFNYIPQIWKVLCYKRFMKIIKILKKNSRLEVCTKIYQAIAFGSMEDDKKLLNLAVHLQFSDVSNVPSQVVSTLSTLQYHDVTCTLYTINIPILQCVII